MNGIKYKAKNKPEFVKRRRLEQPVKQEISVAATAVYLVSCRLMRVLIVDDEPEAANELAWLVHSWGYSVRATCNGHNALRIAAEQHPDVVLLNLAAPQLDWYATASQLRLDFSRSSCFIIAISNQHNQPIDREYKTAEIDILMQHPLDLTVLETLLTLEGMRLNRNLEMRVVN